MAENLSTDFSELQAQIQKVNKEVSRVNKGLEQTNNFMAVVVIVLLVGFAGMFVAVFAIFIDHTNGKEQTYSQLLDRTDKQDTAIGDLKTQVDKLNQPVRSDKK